MLKLVTLANYVIVMYGHQVASIHHKYVVGMHKIRSTIYREDHNIFTPLWFNDSLEIILQLFFFSIIKFLLVTFYFEFHITFWHWKNPLKVDIHHACLSKLHGEVDKLQVVIIVGCDATLEGWLIYFNHHEMEQENIVWQTRPMNLSQAAKQLIRPNIGGHRLQWAHCMSSSPP